MQVLKGKLIVFEGTDASGKSTQFKYLCDYLTKKKITYRKLVFPQYDKESSALIRMYLNGEFGEKPSDVSAYTASTFFAVDRYASFKKDWEQFYNNGGLILADRYTTSNAVHQASKLKGDERKNFLNWLFDFEYNIMGLPEPSHVLFLDVPPECERQLLRNRKGKNDDIHEKDMAYLSDCYNTACEIAANYKWIKINCVNKQKIRTIKDISNEILAIIEGII